MNLHSVPSLGSSFDDKIYHVLAYSILSFLWISAFKTNSAKTKNLAFVSLMLYAITTEVLQHQVNPNRTFDWYDMLGNLSGIFIGTFFAVKFNILKLN